nr:electron transfer flavoprotein subunit alpha/FixB family protein [Deinobacterium chartae]
MIVAEYSGGKLAKSTLEMVAAAHASGREGPLTALVLGQGVASIADEVAPYVDQVLVGDDARLASYNPELWAAATAQIASEGEAHTVFVAGSRAGREFSARVAVKLDAPLLEDVISLEGAGSALRAQRYTYLARVTETVEADAPVLIVSVKPGAFPAAEPQATAGEQYDVDLELPASRVRITGKTVEKSSRVPLAEADVVVTGGRGVGSPERFAELIETLADNIGAGVGATRAVVDAGWRPYSEQVGQTGKTVAPQAYIAVGVSGAVQHMSGMGKSKYIVAVNKDPEAPIFKVADYGIVGDLNVIVPALIEATRR